MLSEERNLLAKQVMHAIVSLFLFCGLCQTALPQEVRAWTFLGEANVDGDADHDRIVVGNSEGTFRAIQFFVERAPIEFHRVVVQYGNGTKEEIEVRNRISAGGKTRVIDLAGKDRFIKTVEFWYGKAKDNSAKPKLKLYGGR